MCIRLQWNIDDDSCEMHAQMHVVTADGCTRANEASGNAPDDQTMLWTIPESSEICSRCSDYGLGCSIAGIRTKKQRLLFGFRRPVFGQSGS